MNKFCEELKKNCQNDSDSCSTLLNNFQMNHVSGANPSECFWIVNAFVWLIVFLWSLVVVIMILRCLFSIDFDVVRVEVIRFNKLNIESDTKEFKSDQSIDFIRWVSSSEKETILENQEQNKNTHKQEY